MGADTLWVAFWRRGSDATGYQPSAGEQEARGRSSRGSAVVDPLSREEDNELRRLNFMSQLGALSERSKLRIIELRIRDRRHAIRPPREFGGH